MIRNLFEIEIITPCFCAGAEQAVAEIRASSVRGQLHWWFRALGGTATEEGELFGAAADEGGSCSSALRIRILKLKLGRAWEIPQVNQNMPENYVWHFASVAGTTVKGSKGPRWNPKGAIPPQTTFTLELLWLRRVSVQVRAKFDLALHAFLAFGTLGLRSTRGLGALFCPASLPTSELEEALTARGFVIRWRQAGLFTSYSSALNDYAKWLRYDCRKRFKAASASPLGSINPRQSSAVRFRPIKLAGGDFTWLAFEAPHSRVLGKQSQRAHPILNGMDFVDPPSVPQPHRY